jgi:DNA-directed RNA polymerase subunit RPC12/RpoP
MKRCPKCKFKRGLPSRPTSKSELFGTRLFLMRHYRCMRCGVRFLGFFLYLRSRKRKKTKPEGERVAPIMARQPLSGD